jgi:glycosyltransferase involved in cell wall biosynthesis
MRILLMQNSVYVPTHGGANKSNRLLLEALAARGHACRVISSGAAIQRSTSGRDGFLRDLAARGIPLVHSSPEADVFELAGVTVHAARSAAHLRACAMTALHDERPTWVLVSSEDPGQNLLEAVLGSRPERVVFLARTTMTLPVGPDAAIRSPVRAQLLSRVAAIVCVSEFLREYVQRWTGHPHVTCLPISFIEEAPTGMRPDPTGGFVTMINPCALKGLPIFEALARRHDAVAFAAVPSWGTTTRDRAVLADLPNVTLLPATDNIDEIFARTRILLVPSLWAEAWGRVVPEAMLRGIPVMAANVGGLPEAKLAVPYLLPVQAIHTYDQALDERMIPIPRVPAQDVRPWSDALHDLTSDRRSYDRIARASHAAARAFVAGHTVDKMEQFLLGLACRTPPVSVPPREARAAPAASGDLRAVIDALSVERRTALLRLLIAHGAGVRVAPTIGHTAAPHPEASDSHPLSFAQERLWFLHQVEPDSPAYNIAQAFWIRGPLQITPLERAVNAIIARHAVLRTTFPAQDGRPVATMLDAISLPLPIVDLTRLPRDVHDSAVRELAVREARRPFVLGKGPLLRVLLIHTGQDEHVLLLMTHHILVDGWSFGLFIEELDAAYRAAITGQPLPAPALPIQYAEYARWHREQVEHGSLAGQLTYWINQLDGGLRPLSLPGDASASRSVRNDAGMTCRFAVAPSTVRLLRDHTRREGVSMYMVLLAAYEVTLRWISRQADFAIACPIANRTRTETERLIGFFVNTLIIRARLADEMTCRDLLRQVRDTTLAAYAHQEVPFERIIDALRPARDASGMPLCSVLFVLQNVPETQRHLHTLTLEPLDLDMRTTRFDLELIMVERAGTLMGRFVYRTARVTPLIVTRILHGYLAALDELLGDSSCTLGEVIRRLDAAQAAREHGMQRALQHRAFTTLMQAGRSAS